MFSKQELKKLDEMLNVIEKMKLNFKLTKDDDCKLSEIEQIIINIKETN